MSLRIRIFIIVGIVVIILGGIIFLLVNNIRQRQKQATTPTTTPGNSAVTIIDSSNFNPGSLPSPAPSTVVTTTQIIADPVEATKASVRQFAKIFVERYGTYSSDTPFQNITDISAMATKNLMTYLTKTATTSTAKNQPFVGATTKVITANVTAWSDTQATVTIQAIRTDEHGSQTITKQISGTVKLIKQGDQWLVDGIYWDK